jgi:hypothetical protein
MALSSVDRELPTPLYDQHIFDLLSIVNFGFFHRLSLSANCPPLKDAPYTPYENVALARSEKVVFHRLQAIP